MNYDDKYLGGLCYGEKRELIKAFKQRHVHPEQLMKLLFADSTYVKENVRPHDLMQYLFFVAMSKFGNDDVLVHVLLNEKEVLLPIETDCTPFYHWRELSRYYRDKLARYTLGN